MLLTKRNIFLNNTYILLLSVFLFQGCIRTSLRDEYKQLGKEKALSREMLFKSIQLIPNNGNLLWLVRSDAKDDRHLNPILFFLDNQKELIGATFLSSNKIDSIQDELICYTLNENRTSLDFQYVGTVPKEYKMRPTVQPDGSFSRCSNTLILDVSVLSNGILATVKKSEDLYYAANWKPWQQDSDFESGFTLVDTLYFSYPQLTFDYKLQEINVEEIRENGSRFVNRMIFKNKYIEQKFYDALYDKFLR